MEKDKSNVAGFNLDIEEGAGDPHSGTLVVTLSSDSANLIDVNEGESVDARLNWDNLSIDDLPNMGPASSETYIDSTKMSKLAGGDLISDYDVIEGWVGSSINLHRNSFPQDVSATEELDGILSFSGEGSDAPQYGEPSGEDLFVTTIVYSAKPDLMIILDEGGSDESGGAPIV